MIETSPWLAHYEPDVPAIVDVPPGQIQGRLHNGQGVAKLMGHARANRTGRRKPFMASPVAVAHPRSLAVCRATKLAAPCPVETSSIGQRTATSNSKPSQG